MRKHIILKQMRQQSPMKRQGNESMNMSKMLAIVTSELATSSFQVSYLSKALPTIKARGITKMLLIIMIALIALSAVF